MVARFANGKGIRGVLNYNESKVAAGEAHLILASGFGGDASKYTFAQKLQRFEHLTVLNSRVKTNAVHISLNFDQQNKLDNQTLLQISLAYMERIGFGDQPFLVYRHYDAAHTHVHIATVNIRPDGSRIDTHGIGWRLSEPARMALEQEFGLVMAKGRNRSNELTIKAVDIEKAVYGRTPTKRAITNVVNSVITNYRFGSLAEFNAVLQQFNVRADSGAEGTLMHEKKGLIYTLINEKGGAVGVPIKASAIYGKPTLPELEKRYALNRERRTAHKESLKSGIDNVIAKYQQITKATFSRELAEKQIAVIFRVNEQGQTYGVTYVDHRNKTVFNGSDLGKAYSAKGLLQRLSERDKVLKPDRSKATGQTQTKTYLPPPAQTNFLQLALARDKQELAPSLPRKKKRRKGKGAQQAPDQSMTQ